MNTVNKLFGNISLVLCVFVVNALFGRSHTLRGTRDSISPATELAHSPRSSVSFMPNQCPDRRRVAGLPTLGRDNGEANPQWWEIGKVTRQFKRRIPGAVEGQLYQAHPIRRLSDAAPSYALSSAPTPASFPSSCDPAGTHNLVAAHEFVLALPLNNRKRPPA